MKVRKNFKKASAAALSVLMMLSVIPVVSFAVNSNTDNNTTRVIVSAENKDAQAMLEKNKATIGSYDDVYLLEFNSEKEATKAVKGLEKIADTVELDTEFTVADDEAVTESTSSSVVTQPVEEEQDVTVPVTESTSKDVTSNATKEDKVVIPKEVTKKDTSKEVKEVAKEVTEEQPSENPLTELSDLIAADEHSKYTIALIDTGANGKVTDAVSILGDDTSDKNGHGSLMVDTILAQNKDAKILSIKAIDDNGKGSIASVYAALEYAKSQNVKIINLSISALATTESSIIEKSINEAIAQGTIVVGAAGNAGSDAALFVPGNIEKAVIVGAADKSGVKLATSNYGTTVDYNVVSKSTSYAAATFSGFISKNGLKFVEKVLNQGLVFEPNYIPAQEKLDNSTPVTGKESNSKVSGLEADSTEFKIAASNIGLIHNYAESVPGDNFLENVKVCALNGTDINNNSRGVHDIRTIPGLLVESTNNIPKSIIYSLDVYGEIDIDDSLSYESDIYSIRDENIRDKVIKANRVAMVLTANNFAKLIDLANEETIFNTSDSEEVKNLIINNHIFRQCIVQFVVWHIVNGVDFSCSEHTSIGDIIDFDELANIETLDIDTIPEDTLISTGKSYMLRIEPYGVIKVKKTY